jgi:cytochrome c oxidase subunit II
MRSVFGRVVAVSSLGILAFASPANAALAPDVAHSPGAEDQRIALWVGLALISIIGLLLLGALLMAVKRFKVTHRYDEPRRLSAGRGVIPKVGAALGAVVLAAFIFGIVVSDGVKQATAEEGTEEIDIDVISQQWLWRFEYPEQVEGSFSEGIATIFSYNELVVPVDTVVNLSVDSTDVVHSWWVPALGPQVWGVPGEIVETSFIADEEGLYKGRSTVFSGSSYPDMEVSVRVVSQDEYEDYIATLGTELREGQRAVQEANETAAAEEASAETSSSDIETQEEEGAE